MTDKPNNPFAGRHTPRTASDCQPQSVFDAQAWCDRQNAMMTRNDHFKPEDHVEWYVAGPRTNPQVRMRYIDTKPDGWPYCTPEEARAILREHPSSFARVMLAAIENRDR